MSPITYTCRKCYAEFSNREAANKHYRSQWHQFNVIRSLKEIPPITEKDYEESMNKSSFLKAAKNGTNVLSCQVCKKVFTSQGSFDTHNRSKRHKQQLIKRTAENIRRLKLQKLRESKLKSENSETLEEENGDGEQECEYCSACKTGFAAKKDYLRHAQTARHKASLKRLRLAAERKQELDKQDEMLKTANTDMEIDEDSDDWEDCENAESMELSEMDVNESLPTQMCLLCGKLSDNLEDNLGHMERQHSFIVPHRKAANLDRLLLYLGEKVGKHRQCLECSKQFRSLKAVRLHMLDKPHLAIRFEGEYDEFYDITEIMAKVVLPKKPKDSDVFMVTLPNGSVLMHRDLRRYFKQNLNTQLVGPGIKRLQHTGPKSLTYLGKHSSEAKSLMEMRKENIRRTKALKASIARREKKRLDVNVKANKLQKHFRQQVMNAG